MTIEMPLNDSAKLPWPNNHDILAIAFEPFRRGHNQQSSMFQSTSGHRHNIKILNVIRQLGRHFFGFCATKGKVWQRVVLCLPEHLNIKVGLLKLVECEGLFIGMNMDNGNLKRRKSHLAYARAKELMPGGVNSAARAFGAVGGEPIVFERGEGAYLFDIDGNRYIDFIGSWGAMILGHQAVLVKQAIHAAVDRGTSFGAPTLAENELAELIVEALPSVEMVRLVSSGTEATMSAIRLARGFTGRDLMVKFSGNYHGHVDSLLVAAGSAAATLSVPNSPGVTVGTTKDTLILGYNNAIELQNAFAQLGNHIAAVIMEPVCGNMGCVIPTEEFLRAVRLLTEQHGTLLIFDEVMTGFRVAWGGAQSIFGVRPDLTTLGKIVGGGLPLGAFGGRRDIMQHVLPAGKVFQAGTLSGNPVATAAGIATLKSLRDRPPYAALEETCERLTQGIAHAADHFGIEHCINRVGSMMTLFFHPGPVMDWNSASKCDTARFAKYFWGLIERGIYMPCSQFEALFVSAVHSTSDIETTIEVISDVMATL
jgi:glutamate-1-semialdehyde 2,1-aminomutase